MHNVKFQCMVEGNQAPSYDGGQSSSSQGIHGEQFPFQK
jgi:hypothetical protein